MKVIEELQRFGFTLVEAKVYAALASTGKTMTGYQIAKEAAIPRANVYPALQRLVTRGAVFEQQQLDATQYLAAPFATLAQSYIQTLNQSANHIVDLLDKTADPSKLRRATGIDAVMTHGLDLIERAEHTLDVGSSVGLVTRFADALERAKTRGVEQRYLCFDNCPGPGCGLCASPLRLNLEDFRSTGWLVMIRDHTESFIVTGYPDRTEVVITTMAPITYSLGILINLRQLITEPQGFPFETPNR